jgi:succinyl-diaminopimelate desuccinylase
MHARITFGGRAAHSARPWEGENAIHKAGGLLQRLYGLAPKETVVGGLVFRETMSVTVAKGGVARNVIPDRFELNLNYRFAPLGEPAAAVRAAQATVRALAPEAKVELVDVAPPGPVPIDNPIVDHLRQHGQLTIAAKEAWTDVGRLALYGIDAVNLGPGDPALAHQDQEQVEIDAMVKTHTLLAQSLRTPLAVPWGR